MNAIAKNVRTFILTILTDQMNTNKLFNLDECVDFYTSNSEAEYHQQ